MTDSILESDGYCSTCDEQVHFTANNAWLRDHFVCSKCGSIPRERALMQVIEQLYPNWRDLTIHESSPGNRGASIRLKNECKNYISSQYFPNKELGKSHLGMQCENLEKLTFEDESVDLHITQDVMEHIFCPEKAFSEIARTLKLGGAHIFTVPLVNKMSPSKVRSKLLNDGSIQYVQPAVYHGNPIDAQGSLVTMDWGYDIARFIFDASGLFTHIIYIDDISKGIRAEFIEVLASIKSLHS